MSASEIIIGIIIMLVSLFLIGVIMLQEGNSRGMGSVAPEASSESYFGNNRGRTFDAILARVTKLFAVLFFILTIVMSVISVVDK